MNLMTLRSAGDVKKLIDMVGIVPLFRSEVKGFSVQEMTPEEYWFKEGVEGPWEWREQLATSGEAVYAKLLSGKAALVGLDLYPHFCNMRREGYDFDARVDEGLVPERERRLYALIEGGMSFSHELRKAYGDKGFETTLTRLQMRTYVAVAGFDRRRDKRGVPYGWNISLYRTAETIFGEIPISAYDFDPADSREVVLDRLSKFIDREGAARLIAYKG